LIKSSVFATKLWHNCGILQLSIQAVIDRVFAKIRNYLNSLDRPELNYDGIKTDIA
jgi:hypothetical protein